MPSELITECLGDMPRVVEGYAAMIYNDVQRTSIFLGDEDRAAIRTIQERYGVSTDSDAIRLALRVLAEAKQIALSPLPPERRKQSK